MKNQIIGTQLLLLSKIKFTIHQLEIKVDKKQQFHWNKKGNRRGLTTFSILTTNMEVSFIFFQ